MNYADLPQYTKDEMLRVLAWELVFGSMRPECAEQHIHLLLDAGANFERR